MLKLTQDRLVGPLKEIYSEPFYIENFFSLEKAEIGFIGHTYAGKSQVIKALTHTLGGVYQEKINDNKRTLDDSCYIFGEIYNGNARQTIRINLKSHAGHDIGYGTDGPKCEQSVVVFKYLKSSTFNKQVRHIRPILEKEKVKIEESYALITRVASDADLTTRRKNMAGKYGFRDIYYVNNPKVKDYKLENFDFGNVELVLEVLEKKYPTLKLIQFGNSDIPEGLEEKLAKFDKHLDIKPVPRNGFVYSDKKEINDIWEAMSKDTIAF